MGIAPLALGASGVRAQDIQGDLLGSAIPSDASRGENTGVADRLRPDYAALGIDVGAFNVLPKASTGFGYLDNVFATPTDKKADGYFIFDPTVTANSDWSTNALSVSLGAQLRDYFTYGSENESGLFAQTDGRLDVTDDDKINAGLFSRRAYEERSSGDYPIGAAAPVEFTQSGGYLRASHEGGQVRVIGALTYDNFDYLDVPALGGGTITQAYRDEDIDRASVRGEYGLTPDTAVFTQVNFTNSNYARSVLPGVANRDSNEYEVLFGATADLSALIRGEIGLGYISRDYSASTYIPLNGFAAEATLTYFPTELTTLTLSGRRLIQDSDFSQAGGYFDNGVNLKVDHELLSNLILNAQVDIERDQYEGVDLNEGIFTVRAGAEYFFTREIGLSFAFEHVSRTSSGDEPGLVFDSNGATLTLTLQR